jgi:hypothetical protein
MEESRCRLPTRVEGTGFAHPLRIPHATSSQMKLSPSACTPASALNLESHRAGETLTHATISETPPHRGGCRPASHQHRSSLSICRPFHTSSSTMARAKISRQPSPYPPLAFHGLRAVQGVSSIIVTSMLGYFVYHLQLEFYYVPWTFLVVSFGPYRQQYISKTAKR